MPTEYLRKARKIREKEGICGVFKRIIYKLIFYYRIRTGLRTLKYYLAYHFLNLFKSERPMFILNGKKYIAFRHWYNATWRNERAVEIPVILDKIKENRDKKILEIGDVIRHYADFPRDILDKYEKGGEIINEDVVDFKPAQKYDLIVSVSTLEHVGWDEEVKDPLKIIRALENLKNNCLTQDGEIVATIPLGYNPPMDELLMTGKIPFVEKYFLKRVFEDSWRQITEKEAAGAKYGTPFPAANVVVFGVIN